MTAHILEQAGLVVGVSTTSGVGIAGRTVVDGDFAGGRAGSVILQDPIVEAGVFELARGGIMKGGLTLEDIDVGIVTNVTPDHLGQDGLDRVEQLIPIKRLVAEIARKAAVLGADDEHCQSMAAGLKAPVWWVARSADNPIVAAHLAHGGNAIVVEAEDGVDSIVHRCGERRQLVVALAAIPATLGGIAVHNVENAQYATAAGLALGLSAEVVGAALGTFDNSFAMSTNRLNIRDVDGIRIVFDFVHNSDGMQKLGRTLAAMPCTGRRILLFAAYLNRGVSEEIFPRIAAVAAPLFDRFVVTERDPRPKPLPTDRPTGESARYFADCLGGAGVPAERIDVVPGVAAAIDKALATARPGDLLLIAERSRPKETWQQILDFRHNGAEGAAVEAAAG
jgi:cyanophycin synthetase